MALSLPLRLLLILIPLLVAACGTAPAALTEPPSGDSPSVASSNPGEVESTPTPTSPASPTASPHPTATPTPSTTPTLTATPLHPMTIEWLRQGNYPGSEIVIEETLENGASYNRYIASYRSEGHKIFALLTVPFGEAPETGFPVVVFNHGYIPPSQYRTTERYVAYVDAFANQGYIVFRSDYRGHGDSEGVARGAYGSPDYTVDILNAVASLKKHPIADPDRIGMWGHSMGGYITLRAMVARDDVKAGVIWAGVVASYEDLLNNWRRGSPNQPTRTPRPGRRSWRAEFGSPEENPEFYAAISANSFLDDLSGPVQLHHGTADTSVPQDFSETLYEQIQAAGLPVELYIYEGDNHNLSVHFSLAMFRSIQFFDRYVKGNGD